MVRKAATKMGEMVRAWGMIYNEVVQLVLLYGSGSWVVMEEMLKLLELFHHWVERIMTGMTVRSTTSGEWEWPLVLEALETYGIFPIKEYIQTRKATVPA